MPFPAAPAAFSAAPAAFSAACCGSKFWRKRCQAQHTSPSVGTLPPQLTHTEAEADASTDARLWSSVGFRVGLRFAIFSPPWSPPPPVGGGLEPSTRARRSGSCDSRKRAGASAYKACTMAASQSALSWKAIRMCATVLMLRMCPRPCDMSAQLQRAQRRIQYTFCLSYHILTWNDRGMCSSMGRRMAGMAESSGEVPLY